MFCGSQTLPSLSITSYVDCFVWSLEERFKSKTMHSVMNSSVADTIDWRFVSRVIEAS